ncbi:hypothetical protein [Streptomyces sp. NPDC017940]|uniref:hypothetical protein n=1 Tax=Streptomyces sp. NPDC017940 TaxID=3365017 RepID=UPI0037BE0D5B
MAEQPRDGHPGSGGHFDHRLPGSGGCPDDDIVLAAALRGLAGQGRGLAAPVAAVEITRRGDRVRRRRFAVLAAAAVVVFGGVSGGLVAVAGPGEGVRPAGRTDGPGPRPAPSSGDSPGPTAVPSASVPPPPSSGPPPSSAAPPPTATATGGLPPTATATGGAPPTTASAGGGGGRTYPPAGGPESS